MTTEEKIKLYNDARSAIRAVGRILDGGHKPEAVEPLRAVCLDAMAGLGVTIAQLEAEVGTDNL
jgi:hypothetical protein